MIELFVKRPVTTAVFVVFFMILGIVSYFNIKIEETPKIDFPIVTIKTIYPGAMPEEVEVQVVKKIEDAIAEISEIKKVTSKSYENFGLIIVEFLLEADVNVKSIEIKDKVDAIVRDLPDNVEKPIVEKFNILAKPVMDLVLEGKDYTPKELYEYSDKKLKQKFSAIQGVAKVDIFGGRLRQINVLLDPQRMNKHFVTIDQVIATIKRKNLNIPGGNIEMVKSELGVRFLGEFQNLKDIENTIITTPEGGKLLLKDIAVIEDGIKKAEKDAYFDGNSVVDMSIINVSDGNAINIARDIRKKLPAIQKTLPEGMTLTIANDNTIFIENETVDTEYNILMGIGLTVLILLLFTANFKVTLISALVIPSSIISTFFLVDFSHFSINMMTLLAIATSLGTLIANAIIIIENVLIHLDKGEDPITSAINGTKEVVVPVLASVGTNLVVFAPIAFMSGIVGRFMSQFGFTVIYATLFSLLASFSLTPMLCALILKPRKEGQKKNFMVRAVDSFMDLLLKEYRIIFNFLFRFPKTNIVLVILVFIFSMKLAPFLGNEFVPNYDKDKIGINMILPLGSRIEVTQQKVKMVEEIAKTIPEVKSVLSKIGNNGVENALVTLNLISYEVRNRSDVDIIQELIPKLSIVPGVEFLVDRGANRGGAESDIEVNVYGKDYDKMIAYSNQIKDIMRESGYFQAVRSSYQNPKPEILFTPDAVKLSEYGIPNVAVALNIRSSIYGDDTNIYKEAGEEYKINVKLRDSYVDFLTDVNDITVMTRKGMIPISEVGKISIGKANPMIQRRDKERIIVLQGNIVKATSGTVQQKVSKLVEEKIKFEDGYGFYYAGSNETKEESQRELGKAFVLATILTFMILAGILNSFVHPFTIATSIFTSLSGVILGLLLLDFSINIASMLGIVMLVGLVVNNAIILIDETMQIQKTGASIQDSLWKAIQNKLRVILMTSFAIIFGTVPQLGSVMQTKASMGAVIIGGMVMSIIFTFWLTPIAYWYMERFQNFLSRRKV